MLKVDRPTPVHFGVYATDLPRMVAFYTEVWSSGSLAFLR